jgi:DNA-binding NtrC family response regulator
MVEDTDDQTTDLHRVQPPVETARFDLSVVAGPNAGMKRSVDATEPMRLLIGKSPACELRITDPRVSRRHLALEVRRGRLRVTDLGSTNGTMVNDVAVFDAELAGGGRIRLGDTVIEVARGQVSDGTASRRRLRNFGPTFGESEPMQRLYPLCRRLASSDVAVIIEGETGTGKEVLAESIHVASARAQGPFVVFDCTTVPANLMEAELFGHEKGAFTGAAGTRKGVFEQAEGGTLLIDEIGDLDIALQPKLLRAVERRQVRRLGSAGPIQVDVRLIAATRRDLDREVAAGRFRDDLFHRLAVARIELPPLRERPGDIRVLAERFCEELGVDILSVPAELMARWEDASWPGNLRELRNAVARWVALGEMEGLQAHEGRPRRGDADEVDRILEMRLPFADARQQLVSEFERRYVERVLAENGGNVSRAAAASGIGRRYFHMLLARNGKR